MGRYGVASIAKRADGRWRARYRDASGKEHARHFPRKVEAQRWLNEVTTAVVTGTYVDPRTRTTTVADYAARWQSAQVARTHTLRNLDVALRVHVLPYLGDHPIASIRPTDVQALVKALSLTLSPGTVGLVLRVTKQLFAAAVDDRLIPSSPCLRVRPPRDVRPPMVIPTVEQVHALADDVPPLYRALVILLAGAGLRIGEALGLEVGDIDWLRCTVQVQRQRTRAGTYGPTKTEASVRTVPLGQVVVEELVAHVAAAGLGHGDPLFVTELGEPLQYRVWLRLWTIARRRTGIDVGLHDLRHFTASALIGGGASVKQVQTVLGHGSAKQTLDTYSHMWPGDDDRTRAVMDAVLGAPADHLRTEEVVAT